MKKNAVSVVVIILLGAFSLSSCIESHYYRKNNRHSDGYERRHRGQPGGVRLEIRK
jgi:hypothetical protein